MLHRRGEAGIVEQQVDIAPRRREVGELGGASRSRTSISSGRQASPSSSASAPAVAAAAGSDHPPAAGAKRRAAAAPMPAVAPVMRMAGHALASLNLLEDPVAAAGQSSMRAWASAPVATARQSAARRPYAAATHPAHAWRPKRGDRQDRRRTPRWRPCALDELARPAGPCRPGCTRPRGECRGRRAARRASRGPRRRGW